MNNVVGFFGSTIVRKLDGPNWETQVPLAYYATRQTFIVPVGSATDFASVPRVFAWLIPRAGDSVPAADDAIEQAIKALGVA